MNIGIAADHAGFDLKKRLSASLQADGHEVTDFGDREPNSNRRLSGLRRALLALAVANGKVSRGIAICGSGVGVSVAANKVAGVRASLIGDSFSARQGVEDDDMNVLCLGAGVTGPDLALVLVRTFLNARFKRADRFRRRLKKVASLEKRS
jgi:ribose 5-phosphate isomerase B